MFPVLFLSSISRAGLLLYAHDSRCNLYTVDVQTRVAELIGNTGRVFTDIAFDKDGNLFGISNQARYWTEMGLYRIDPTNAAVFKIGDLRTGGYVNALMFDEEGTLWAAGDLAIITINPLTGAGRFFSDGVSKYGSAGDLALDPSLNMVLTTDAGLLVRIDRSSGAVTKVGKIPQTKVYGCATGEDDRMYGITSDNQLMLINPQTGAASILGPIQASFAIGETNGTSFRGACIPEPATLLLLAAGIYLAQIKKKVLRI
jgi:streptogramin lyase